MSNKNQKGIFLQTEGDQWYERNIEALQEKKSDPIVDLIIESKIAPKTILEIGCSNGWRLNILKKKLDVNCFGLEPSLKAINEGKLLFPDLILEQGTADEINFKELKFDLIIFGFCLYLCDRKDLFKIVYEADKYLNEGGYLIILDFEPTFSFKNKYQYVDGLYSYKMNYSNLFLANPSYYLLQKKLFTHYGLEKIDHVNERISITLIKKNSESAYIENPY